MSKETIECALENYDTKITEIAAQGWRIERDAHRRLTIDGPLTCIFEIETEPPEPQPAPDPPPEELLAQYEAALASLEV